MSASRVIKGLVERIAPATDVGDVNWPVEDVERLVGDLNLEGYLFDYEPKTVALRSVDDLFAVMNRAGKSAVASHARLSVVTRSDKVYLQVGGWQFQAEAPN